MLIIKGDTESHPPLFFTIFVTHKRNMFLYDFSLQIKKI